MENEEKLVIFDKYPNELDANIVKGAIEASGIHAGVLGDSTANAVWMAPVSVVVFRRDLEAAIMAVYQGEKNYEDYQDEMDLPAFENMQACNRAFGELALKIHPEIGGKQYRDVLAQAKDALAAGDLKTLTAMNEQISAPVAAAANVTSEEPVGEPKSIHGWLLLYLVLAVIFDVAALAILVSSNLSSLLFPVEKGYEVIITGFLIVASCVMTAFVVQAFKNRKPDAVFLGHHHVIINAAPIACVLGWLLSRLEQENVVILLFLLFFGSLVVWRYFFNSSSQVKALIPPATRKVSSMEKYIVSFLYLVIAVLFCFHSGFEKWWNNVFIVLFCISLSPLMDLPADLGKTEEGEQD